MMNDLTPGQRDMLDDIMRARLRRSAPPPPVLDIPWSSGPDALLIVVRQGKARPPYWETLIAYQVPSVEEGDLPGTFELHGHHTRTRLLTGYAATVTGAAMRGLAVLSAAGRWSTDLRDYVLGKAVREDRMLRDLAVLIVGQGDLT